MILLTGVTCVSVNVSPEQAVAAEQPEQHEHVGFVHRKETRIRTRPKGLKTKKRDFGDCELADGWPQGLLTCTTAHTQTVRDSRSMTGWLAG